MIRMDSCRLYLEMTSRFDERRLSNLVVTFANEARLFNMIEPRRFAGLMPVIGNYIVQQLLWRYAERKHQQQNKSRKSLYDFSIEHYFIATMLQK